MLLLFFFSSFSFFFSAHSTPSLCCVPFQQSSYLNHACTAYVSLSLSLSLIFFLPLVQPTAFFWHLYARVAAFQSFGRLVRDADREYELVHTRVKYRRCVLSYDSRICKHIECLTRWSKKYPALCFAHLTPHFH